MADAGAARRGSRSARVLSAGLVTVGLLAGGCGVPRAESQTGGPALGTAGPVPPVPSAPTASATSTGASTTTRSATPTASDSPTTPSRAEDTALVATEIDYDDRSLQFDAPRGWTRTTRLRNAERNRTDFTEPGSDVLVRVEIADPTGNTPLFAARWSDATRRGQGGRYALRGISSGPREGATWEYTYVDASGRTLRAVDWFATVGSTGVALYVSAPVGEWSAARALWSRMVDSVRAGDSPPGWTGPGDSSPSPRSSATPADDTGPTEEPEASPTDDPTVGPTGEPSTTPTAEPSEPDDPDDEDPEAGTGSGPGRDSAGDPSGSPSPSPS